MTHGGSGDDFASTTMRAIDAACGVDKSRYIQSFFMFPAKREVQAKLSWVVRELKNEGRMGRGRRVHMLVEVPKESRPLTVHRTCNRLAHAFNVLINPFLTKLTFIQGNPIFQRWDEASKSFVFDDTDEQFLLLEFNNERKFSPTVDELQAKGIHFERELWAFDECLELTDKQTRTEAFIRVVLERNRPVFRDIVHKIESLFRGSLGQKDEPFK